MINKLKTIILKIKDYDNLYEMFQKKVGECDDLKIQIEHLGLLLTKISEDLINTKKELKKKESKKIIQKEVKDFLNKHKIV